MSIWAFLKGSTKGSSKKMKKKKSWKMRFVNSFKIHAEPDLQPDLPTMESLPVSSVLQDTNKEVSSEVLCSSVQKASSESAISPENTIERCTLERSQSTGILNLDSRLNCSRPSIARASPTGSSTTPSLFVVFVAVEFGLVFGLIKAIVFTTGFLGCFSLLIYWRNRTSSIQTPEVKEYGKRDGTRTEQGPDYYSSSEYKRKVIVQGLLHRPGSPVNQSPDFLNRRWSIEAKPPARRWSTEMNGINGVVKRDQLQRSNTTL